MEGKNILIIGGGVAGLSAGCYALMNGYHAEIFEMHTVAGGLCTGWNRKGYTFDGCIHWLVGTNPDRFFHKMWKELGVLEGKSIHFFEEFARAEDEDGNAAVLYSDPERLRKHFDQLSPEDAAQTGELVRLIKHFSNFDMSMDKPVSMYGLFDLLKMMRQMRPFMKDFKKISSVTVGEFTEQFSHPLIRRVLTSMMPPEYALSALVITLGDYASGNAGFPAGGSLSFAASLESRFKKLGGKIHYKSKVKTILIEGKRAAGVELSDGTKIYGDAVISAADGRTTWYDFLGKQFASPKVLQYYENTDRYETYTSLQVYFGVNCNLSDEPEVVSVPLDGPIEIAGQKQDMLLFHHYCHDPSLTPKGKSVVMTLVNTPYEYWETLAKNPELYRSEKTRITEDIQCSLEKRFPQTIGRVEAVDVVTPMTYVRYTGVWRGAYMSWLMTPKSGRVMVPNKVKGLNDFYTAGIWTMPSGLPAAALTGRWVIQQICRRDRKKFSTSLPHYEN